MHPFNDSSPITLRMSAGRLLHKVGAATAKEQPSIVVSVLIIGRCNKDSTYSKDSAPRFYTNVQHSIRI